LLEVWALLVFWAKLLLKSAQNTAQKCPNFGHFIFYFWAVWALFGHFLGSAKLYTSRAVYGFVT